MSYAEVKKVNGSPALVIDGKTHPPMAMTVRFNKPDYIHDLGQSGMKVFFLMTNTEWLRPGKDYVDENGEKQHEPSGMEAFIHNAEVLLKESARRLHHRPDRPSSTGRLDGRES